MEKENGNYYNGVTLGLYWGYIGLRVAEERCIAGTCPKKAMLLNIGSLSFGHNLCGFRVKGYVFRV